MNSTVRVLLLVILILLIIGLFPFGAYATWGYYPSGGLGLLLLILIILLVLGKL